MVVKSRGGMMLVIRLKPNEVVVIEKLGAIKNVTGRACRLGLEFPIELKIQKLSAQWPDDRRSKEGFELPNRRARSAD